METAALTGLVARLLASGRAAPTVTSLDRAEIVDAVSAGCSLENQQGYEF
jgi:hypothetical protein